MMVMPEKVMFDVAYWNNMDSSRISYTLISFYAKYLYIEMTTLLNAIGIYMVLKIDMHQISNSEH